MPRPRILAVLLGAFALVDARAATFTLESPAVLMEGGSVTFSYTSESGAWPLGTEGAEQPAGIRFNGACTNSRGLFRYNQYGYDDEVTFPGPGWETLLPYCEKLRPGDYVASLDYSLFDGVTSTNQQIDLHFTVLGLLG